MNNVMQIEIIPSEARGVTQNEWLNSHHSFNFGQYFDTNRLNFGTLRVLNEDVMKGGKGFDSHSHENMEIITVVLEGSLKHKDSLGEERVLIKGDVQRMSAGSGIVHSEYNNSPEEDVHFLQIWIYPKQRELPPSYEKKHFLATQLKNAFLPIVSHIPGEASVFIHQDATLFLGYFDKGQVVTYTPMLKNHGDFLLILEGEVKMGDKVLGKGDAAQISHAEMIELQVLAKAKILLIEVSLITL